jgi:hypothetical protein
MKGCIIEEAEDRKPVVKNCSRLGEKARCDKAKTAFLLPFSEAEMRGKSPRPTHRRDSFYSRNGNSALRPIGPKKPPHWRAGA